MKTTVIHHSADFDGLFCREIARRFLPDAELIGWDFGDAPLTFPTEGQVYVMDIPVDRVFGFDFDGDGITKHTMDTVDLKRVVWIDHHKSSIQTHPDFLPGYRIDGVSACRLAWFYFTAWARYISESTVAIGQPVTGGVGHQEWFQKHYPFATKQDFIDRKVEEPLAVRLAGEYDVFDLRDPRAELFQFGLRAQELTAEIWETMLGNVTDHSITVDALLERGKPLAYACGEEYREVITQQGFEIKFEGLTFLACNSHELDIRSQLFAAAIKPHYDGLLGFTFNGRDWRVSIYNPPGKDNDMSVIAKRHGGGGHRGASGFRCSTDKMLAILSEVPF